MSKRTILLLSYVDPENDTQEACGVIAALTKRQVISRIKQFAKKEFAEKENFVSGEKPDYKLGTLQLHPIRWNLKVGQEVGRFPIISTDGSGECEDYYTVSTVPYMDVT